MSKLWTACELLLLLATILCLGLPSAQASTFKKERIGSDMDHSWLLGGSLNDCGILPIVAYLGSREKPTARQSGVAWLVDTPAGPRILTPAHVAAGAGGVVVYCKGQEYELELEYRADHYDLAVLKSTSQAAKKLRQLSNSEALITLPLSQENLAVIEEEKARWKKHSEGANPTLTSILVGIDHSIPAPKAPELWLTASVYSRSRSPYDIFISPGVRPGFSGAALLSRIPKDRALPIAMVQQTINPGSQARGISITRINDLVLTLIGYKSEHELLNPSFKISWSLEPGSKSVLRTRKMLLQRTLGKEKTLTDTCTSSLYSQVSNWGPVGGADWGDGGGSDWADGGEGSRNNEDPTQENPPIPRDIYQGQVNFDWSQMTGMGNNEHLQALNANFFPIPFIYYRPGNNCKEVGLKLNDGRVLVGLKVPDHDGKKNIFTMRELEDVIDLFGKLKPPVKERNRLKFIEEHAIWLPSTGRMRLPICEAFPNGLYAGKGASSFDYGIILKRFKSALPDYFRERAAHESGNHLSILCNESGTVAEVTHKDFFTKWSSRGVEGWVLVNGKKHEMAQTFSDPFSFELSAAGTTVHFSGLALNRGDGLELHIMRQGAKPWMENTYYYLHTQEHEDGLK